MVKTELYHPQLFSHQLMAIFAASDELLEIGAQALRTISIGFSIIGPAIIGATTFQAIGKGMPSLFLSFLRQIILLLPLAYVLGNASGLQGVWYAFPIVEVISFITMFFWLKATLKKRQGTAFCRSLSHLNIPPLKIQRHILIMFILPK